jgi:UDP-N-acetyl-D-mannosaminuronate dehydrogenase
MIGHFLVFNNRNDVNYSLLWYELVFILSTFHTTDKILHGCNALRDAVNTKWNVNILEPREGIGWHCLPKDIKMFLQSSKSIRSKILAAAMEVDKDYKRSRAKLYSQISV